ncbi:MAG: MBL fold metallo-hydrolase [marine bacterium B5-7]|nr:MAG: MBL fold metallo-hydrolase [marine bacterium B5-7]
MSSIEITFNDIQHMTQFTRRSKSTYILWATLITGVVHASDSYQPVAENIIDNLYAIIGPTGPRTYNNHALNNNLGFIVTSEGVVLIDSGASNQGARLIEHAVASVTEKPVRWVINTGSQDHRWLGNSYFADKGAEIIALQRTVQTQNSFAEQHLTMLSGLLGETFEGTRAYFAEQPVDADFVTLTLGGEMIELEWLGDAHFPGDAVVFHPRTSTLFSGDLIYIDRMLGILPFSDVIGWQSAFHKSELLNPVHIVPGHGPVSNSIDARRDTGDYLDWLVSNLTTAVEEWRGIDDTVNAFADAPQFMHLEHYDQWHRTNINRVYLQLENR